MSDNSGLYYYHNDHLGTPQRLTNATTGSIAWSAGYAAFGKATIDPLSTIENNLRFPGQYYDEETGLHYNWMRTYDPGTGRYTQVDPLGFWAGDVNLYRYVGGDSVNWIDPDGLKCTYYQSTGRLVCVDRNGEKYLDETGYSGKGNSCNNPYDQDKEDSGPVPRGKYTVGSPVPFKGSTARPLTPDAQTRESFPKDRKPDSFYLHGDNKDGNKSASEGCVILNIDQGRNRIPDGEEFEVVK